MKNVKLGKMLMAPALVAAMTVPLTGGCSAAEEAAKQGDCSATAEGKAFLSAVTSLETAAGKLKVDVATACRNIAVADGKTTDWDGTGTPSDDNVTQACKIATDVIAAVKAAGTFNLVIEGQAKCEANVSAQAQCTAECDVEGQCKADVSAYCDPGELSGKCEGECKVGASCEGSPEFKVDCEGKCSGTCEVTITGGSCSGKCEGDCSGTCSAKDGGGKCAGQCDGQCTGSCSEPSGTAVCKGKCDGSCEVTQPSFKCQGEAKCTGGCSVDYKEPSCTGEVKASCDAKAECKGSCQASAQAEAKCTPPKVSLVADGSIDAKVIAALEAELPKLLVVAEAQGKALVGVLGQVTAGIEGAIKGSAACALKLTAFAEASASVSVSFKASASASGSAQTK